MQIVTSLSADDFGDWEGKEFAPEAKFLEKLKVAFALSNRTTKKPRASVRTKLLNPTSSRTERFHCLAFSHLNFPHTPSLYFHFSSFNSMERNEYLHAIPSTFDTLDYWLGVLTLAKLEIAVQAIDGVSQVETQTYTIMPM